MTLLTENQKLQLRLHLVRRTFRKTPEDTYETEEKLFQSIKDAHGGAYPDDWFDSVIREQLFDPCSFPMQCTLAAKLCAQEQLAILYHFHTRCEGMLDPDWHDIYLAHRAKRKMGRGMASDWFMQIMQGAVHHCVKRNSTDASILTGRELAAASMLNPDVMTRMLIEECDILHPSNEMYVHRVMPRTFTTTCNKLPWQIKEVTLTQFLEMNDDEETAFREGPHDPELVRALEWHGTKYDTKHVRLTSIILPPLTPEQEEAIVSAFEEAGLDAMKAVVRGILSSITMARV